jgi:8-oxo-dGTP diphosphatase
MDSARLHLEVAAGVVCDGKGLVLIAQRPAKAHQGGLWEFPGGKLEAGESVEDALVRELQEEIGIFVQSSEPLISLLHHYPDRTVRLHVREVLAFTGEAKGLEGQPIRWVAPGALDEYAFPDANHAIRTAVQLPKTYPILNIEDHPPAFLEAILDHWERQGIRLVRFRTRAEFSDEALLRVWIQRARAVGIEVLVDGDADRMRRVGAGGLHLRSDVLKAFSMRPIPDDFWLAASCHDVGDLEAAERVAVDFAVLGPLAPTETHPGAGAMGWQKFQRLVDTVSYPVYALGGLVLQDLGDARRYGGQGVAAIRAFLPVMPGKGA